MTRANGDRYEGEWKDELLDGIGTEIAKMTRDMKNITNKATNVVKDSLDANGANISEVLTRTQFQDLEFILGLMEEDMKANGRKGECMDVEFMYALMGKRMMPNGVEGRQHGKELDSV
eukprot:CAMPEP_0176420270 /NCGR_PEP_ID=MMETSP0127-20121128/8514_1 /TAXON_ID=938130 /ORGANISM="Platyophrya macrostoma, Strain WH" /LENGTH=117 /DNA_ID=CAMNT_0017800849 /DNA_START=1 /DNA_END=356 /DNA_ORIENTATION=-